MKSPVPRNTRLKTALQEQKSKGPNVVIFIDTSGRIYENLHLDWLRIYSIFDNDDFSGILHDQQDYIRIRSSQLHLIAARPPFIPYTDPVKWVLDHTKNENHVFNDHIGTFFVVFNPDIFSKAYALGPSKQLLSHKFLDKETSRFDYEEVVK